MEAKYGQDGEARQRIQVKSGVRDGTVYRIQTLTRRQIIKLSRLTLRRIGIRAQSTPLYL
jgi:hypothetical protein